ncbi:MAG TPA: hypothetical protein VFL62_10580 [Bradyrhizobium sp.]|uniref:hypothetical protein n=1 Tax=Bradyrhizobium sp. TaxID=376 RepID=UPI002D802DB6|nr:hypothetical protein [Bradyrhizobium sp.]HET7886662.1 hypothetical protein [Bradyrhizobium sp.]
MTFDLSSGIASRRLRVLVDFALRELGERFVGLLFLAERVSRSFTAWYRPSSDIVCHREAADQLKQHHRVKRQAAAGSVIKFSLPPANGAS